MKLEMTHLRSEKFASEFLKWLNFDDGDTDQGKFDEAMVTLGAVIDHCIAEDRDMPTVYEEWSTEIKDGVPWLVLTATATIADSNWTRVVRAVVEPDVMDDRRRVMLYAVSSNATEEWLKHRPGLVWQNGVTFGAPEGGR